MKSLVFPRIVIFMTQSCDVTFVNSSVTKVYKFCLKNVSGDPTFYVSPRSAIHFTTETKCCGSNFRYCQALIDLTDY